MSVAYQPSILLPVLHRGAGGVVQRLNGLACCPPLTSSRDMAARYSKAYRSKEGTASLAKVYPDINVVRPREYWDYEALSVQWGDQENYEVRHSCRQKGVAKDSGLSARFLDV